MHTYRIGDAAALLGVTADTLRRLVDGGKLTAERDELGRRIIPGTALAAYARQVNRAGWGSTGSSARNRLSGIVTDVPPRGRAGAGGDPGPDPSGWWRWSAAGRPMN